MEFDGIVLAKARCDVRRRFAQLGDRGDSCETLFQAIDDTDISQKWYCDTDNLLIDLFLVERGSQCFAGLGQKQCSSFRNFGCLARRLLANQAGGLLFGLLPRSQVTSDFQESFGVTILIPKCGNGDTGPETRTVLTHPPTFIFQSAFISG